jgi:hypothetical protein
MVPVAFGSFDVAWRCWSTTFFVGCIPVTVSQKGDITVIPCGDRVEQSASDAF